MKLPSKDQDQGFQEMTLTTRVTHLAVTKHTSQLLWKLKYDKMSTPEVKGNLVLAIIQFPL